LGTTPNEDGNALSTPDRRADLRLEVNLPAQLRTVDGQSFSAIVSNLSRSGLQLTLSTPHTARMLPNVDRDQKNIPVCIDVEFDATLAESVAQISVQCGIVYLRRTSQETCIIGVKFREFYRGSEEPLAGFYLELLERTAAHRKPR